VHALRHAAPAGADDHRGGRPPARPRAGKERPGGRRCARRGRQTDARPRRLHARGRRDFRQLHKTADGKGEYFVALREKKGEELAAHLAEIVAQALKKLPIRSHALGRFRAPVRAPGAWPDPAARQPCRCRRSARAASGRTTIGHRFLSSGEITIDHPDEYAARLAGQGHRFLCRAAGGDRAQLAAAASQLDARLNPADGLLDEVTALVEWPVVYVGEFEAEYLVVPQECLILTMQQNQKYFPLLDGSGKLLNRFLIVSNMQVDDPANIIRGNERVVRPRLSDARFFYDQDRKNGFANRVVRLGAVVYHHKLGSLGDRAQRLWAYRAQHRRKTRRRRATSPSARRCSPRSTC
jgi:glycyl-tRNA synthetase beta chain